MFAGDQMENIVEIREGDKQVAQAEAAILVPMDAPEMNEKMAMVIAGSSANAKHTFHALSEIALIDYEDHELVAELFPDGVSLSVAKGDDCMHVDFGIVIARDGQGKTRLFAHEGVDVYRLIKFAHRHCTRWVRLDI
jgi:hypothetical protein